jgi:pimeloyl-ACP methyl ester carboxylesterase
MRNAGGFRTVGCMTMETTVPQPAVPQPATGNPRERLLDGSQITERRIDADGISTAVLECGAGPPVVLLHGPVEAAIASRDTIVGLGRTHRVIAPDLPGHGESAAPVQLDAERALAWLDDVIAQSCDVPPVLVGRVLGGAIAMRYCLDHPERVDRLVLVDTLGLAPFRPAPPFDEALQRFLADPSARTHDQLMEYCAHDFDALRARLGERWTAIAEYAVDRARLPTTLESAMALMAEFGFGEIPEGVLARIAVPTTLIWGRHDLATPLRIAESASRTFGWPLHVVDHAADDPGLEQPDAFLEVLSSVIEGGSR